MRRKQNLVLSVIKQHHAFYEVLPYYVVLEERSPGTTPTTKKIPAGFDVDIYGAKTSDEPVPSSASDYRLAYSALSEVVEAVSSNAGDSCTVEVIPFGSTIIVDTRRGFQPEAMLRVRISHQRGLNQPAGKAEESALRHLEEHLHALGLMQSGRQGL